MLPALELATDQMTHFPLHAGGLQIFDVDHGQCALLTMPGDGGTIYRVLIDCGHAVNFQGAPWYPGAPPPPAPAPGVVPGPLPVSQQINGGAPAPAAPAPAGPALPAEMGSGQ